MILLWLLLVPAVGGVLAWAAGAQHPDWPRWIALFVLAIDLVLALTLIGPAMSSGHAAWIASLDRPWIPQLGISFELDLDGLSLVLILLSIVLGLVSVVISWTEITDRVGLFHANLLWTTAGVIGVFLALDLFLFFFFWELMLVPMYFLIALWGHEHRFYAAIKFFIFTQGSGLVMLVAILVLVFVHQQTTGHFTFDYLALLGTKMSASTSFWLMLGFFLAFAVKLPAVPFHTWLPDAHTEAPTAGSVLLAGILLKTGAYGLLRFVVPLFPDAAHAFAPIAMALGVIGILYGALLAFGQNDMKRLVAYSSVSHMGFVLLGVFAWNALALQGVVVQMLAHGISTGALFILVGALQERIHTRDMRLMGGLWGTIPRLSAFGMVFAIASLGLPGLGNFIGEFLILLGSFHASVAFTVIAAGGLVAGAAYALLLVQRAFHGRASPHPGEAKPIDLTAPHLAVMGLLLVAIIGLGLYPQPVFDQVAPGLAVLEHDGAPSTGASTQFAEGAR
ncbi:MAG TPA: NADH-quinone oxidoreductase subunit M [Acidisoma sp.]|jgi:NADH-quinone oxidoreductase subunit M|nr:NADH-quinone oxidoreductase subunit M [Acidisoma sp.]